MCCSPHVSCNKIQILSMLRVIVIDISNSYQVHNKYQISLLDSPSSVEPKFKSKEYIPNITVTIASLYRLNFG